MSATLDRRPRTTAMVNRAIAALDLELVRGEGYFYFVPTADDSPARWAESTSVLVLRVSDLSLYRWQNEARRVVEEGAANDPALWVEPAKE